MNRILYSFLLSLFLLGTGNLSAQTISGIVLAKSPTIKFEDVGSENQKVNGEIKSNITGSKYTLSLTVGGQKVTGEIKDKLSKFLMEVKVGDHQITGEIDRAPNHTLDTWDVDFMGEKITGKVQHNMMNSKNSYELQYEKQPISGNIKDHLNGLNYELNFLGNPITGEMTYNVTTVKHTYNLTTSTLSEEEFILWWFIESIKLLHEHVDEVDEFQNNN